MNDIKYDLFISYASEDREALVHPLANALSRAGYRVWYDEFVLSLGFSLRKAIDKGITQSRFGIVVLSKAFFSKGWTLYELDGLTQFDIADPDQGLILPIWYNIEHADLLSYSASLAGKVAIQTDGSNIAHVVEVLEKRIGEFVYSVGAKGQPIRSERKVSIDISRRRQRFQLISNHFAHRIFSRGQSVVTSDTIIYPYERLFDSLKYNHWQSNVGVIQPVSHVAYDVDNGHMISFGSEVLENDGCRFVSQVRFKRLSEGPVRIICELKTTDFFKSVFEHGSDEITIFHRIPIELFTFSVQIPDTEDFKNFNVYADGEELHFTSIPGGRIVQYKLIQPLADKTVFSFVNSNKS